MVIEFFCAIEIQKYYVWATEILEAYIVDVVWRQGTPA